MRNETTTDMPMANAKWNQLPSSVFWEAMRAQLKKVKPVSVANHDHDKKNDPIAKMTRMRFVVCFGSLVRAM